MTGPTPRPSRFLTVLAAALALCLADVLSGMMVPSEPAWSPAALADDEGDDSSDDDGGSGGGGGGGSGGGQSGGGGSGSDGGGGGDNDDNNVGNNDSGNNDTGGNDDTGSSDNDDTNETAGGDDEGRNENENEDEDEDDDDDEDESGEASESENGHGSLAGSGQPGAGDTSSFEADRIIAVNIDRTSLAGAVELGYRVEAEEDFDSLDIEVTKLRAPRGVDAIAARRELAREDPSGLYVLNHVYRLAGGGCTGERCYGSDLIGWQRNDVRCRASTRVGLIDTAVDLAHPALRQQQVASRSFAPEGTAPSPQGHGTAVAALLVGTSGSAAPGLLPDSALFAADTFHVDAEGMPAADLISILSGLEWLASQKVEVINMSFAGPKNLALENAMNRMRARDVLVVAAVGNHGPGAPPAYPAAYDEVLAVTAIDAQLRPYRYAIQGDHVTLAAPGVNIWSAAPDGSFDYHQGTSFAAPFVTAAAAAAAQVHGRGKDPNAATETLIRRARDLGRPGKDPVYGWGLVQTPPECRG